MAFHEIQFPTEIAKGAVGGPSFSTTVIATAAGEEQRNGLWDAPRYVFNVATGLRDATYYITVRNFFLIRRGRLRGFRFKDWSDHCSTALGIDPANTTALDQALGLFANAPMQLVKTYSDAAGSLVRKIRKPIDGTVKVAVAGVAQASPGWSYPWSLDATTGLVTFTGSGGTLPSVGAAITAGFEFDVPVRFDRDDLPASYEQFRALNVQDINLIELRRRA